MQPILSHAAGAMKRSLMRELLQHAADTSIISLATGLPPSESLPAAALQACFDTVLQRDGASALQYGAPDMALREWIAGYMQRRGVVCEARHIFITNGSQQSLTILARTLLDPGDTALLEAVTFTGIEKAIVSSGAVARTVNIDLETGLNMTAFEAALCCSPHPKLAVVIPDFHNPLGLSLNLQQRQQLAQTANQHGVPLIEDDPYSALRFAGEMLPPVKAYDTDGFVFYLGSFSKILAPTLRLGWMVIPEALYARITMIREAIDLESSVLVQRAVMEFLRRGELEPHLARLRAVLAERCSVMMQALDCYLGDTAVWTRPEGGLFTWVTLPHHIDTLALVQHALAAKVLYVPGSAFAVEGGCHNTLRLNFGSVPPAQIEEGVRRLAQVIRAQIK